MQSTDAAVKEGRKLFRIGREIILNPTPGVLLDSAEPVKEGKK